MQRSYSSSSSDSSRRRRSKHRRSSRYKKSKNYSRNYKRSRSRSKTSSRHSRSTSKDLRTRRSHSRDKHRHKQHYKSKSYSKSSNSKYHSRSNSSDSKNSSTSNASKSSNTSSKKNLPQNTTNNPEEQLREKLLKAIKAAESADHQLKQQGVLPKGVKSRNDIGNLSQTKPTSDVIKDINADVFVQKSFTSSKQTTDEQSSVDSNVKTNVDESNTLAVYEKSIFHSNVSCSFIFSFLYHTLKN